MVFSLNKQLQISNTKSNVINIGKQGPGEHVNITVIFYVKY